MNNTTILQKCVEELKKETPNIPYILGTLETLIEMSGNVTSTPINNTYVIPTQKEEVATERNPITEAGPIGHISTY